jgi:hypothetical protein
MIGRLFATIWLLLACFCVATIASLGISAAYLWGTGRLDQARARRVLAMLRGSDLPAPATTTETKAADPPELTVSLDDLAAARGLAMRNLELREQSLRQAVSQLEFERGRLAEEKGRFFREKTGFENRLDERARDLETLSHENVRLILENMKPKQVKEQILLMLRQERMDEVVEFLAAMPIAKRAKIAGEFKSPEEAEKLSEILALMRDGVPEAGIIDAARERIEKAPSPTP